MIELIFNNLIIGSEIITDKLPLIPNTIKIINKCQLLLALKNFLNLLIVFPYEFNYKKRVIFYPFFYHFF